MLLIRAESCLQNIIIMYRLTKCFSFVINDVYKTSSSCTGTEHESLIDVIYFKKPIWAYIAPSLLFQETFPWLPSTLADVLEIVDVETACSDELTREKFITLVGALPNTIIADCLLKERLDQDSLELVGLVSSQVGYNQKYVKTETRLYYKQQKFNLLREESCFDLHPNRMLDVILEAFECHPEECLFYVPLLRAYIIDKLTLCHILGFKFHFRESADWSTPKSLFTCAALLLKNELVDLNDLYSYLLPADSEIIPFHNKEVSDAKAYAKKLSTVILADKKEDEKKEEEQQIIDLRENIQKLGLCEALLEIGAWENARAIIDRLPENFVLVHPSISYALCSLVNRVIEPLYEKNIGHANVVLPGPYASRDPILMVKIMRLAKAFMSKHHSGGIGPEDDIAYYGFLNALEESQIHHKVKYDELKKLKDKKNHKTICYINAYKEVMGPVVEAIKPVFSSKIWDDLTPQFYITFWSLSMYDLYVPKGAYEKQIFCRKIKSVQWKLTKTCLSARNVKSKKDARS
nr:THO complex subunit 2 [Biomphalaria glabrata]